MGYMKNLHIKLQNGDELTDSEKSYVDTFIDREWDEYDQYVTDETNKVGRIG